MSSSVSRNPTRLFDFWTTVFAGGMSGRNQLARSCFALARPPRTVSFRAAHCHPGVVSAVWNIAVLYWIQGAAGPMRKTAWTLSGRFSARYVRSAIGTAFHAMAYDARALSAGHAMTNTKKWI